MALEKYRRGEKNLLEGQENFRGVAIKFFRQSENYSPNPLKLAPQAVWNEIRATPVLLPVFIAQFNDLSLTLYHLIYICKKTNL